VLDGNGNSVQALDINGIAVQANAGLPIAMQMPGAMNPPAAPAGPNELEWLGLDLRSTANRPPPPPPPGVAVTAVGDRGANAGVIRGDVVVAVDGMPTPDTAAFLNATANGAKRGARLEVMRNQRIALDIGQPAPAPIVPQQQLVQGVSPGAPVAWSGAPSVPQGWPQPQSTTPLAMARWPDTAVAQPNVAGAAIAAPIDRVAVQVLASPGAPVPF
jgi:hypothetical protein